MEEKTTGLCECIGEVADGESRCPDCGREYGLPIDVTTDGYGVTFTEFSPSPDAGAYQLGAEALAYVLANGHTISVSLQAARFARTAAINAMHGRGSDDPVVRNVSKALDMIDRYIRAEEAAERAEGARAEVPAGELPPDGGKRDGNRAEELRPKPKSPIGPVPAGAIKF